MAEIPSTPQIFYASTNDGFLVVRVVGRGDSSLSPSLKHVLEQETATPQTTNPHYIIDLAGCSALDSTFMGVMAEMGLKQMSRSTAKMQVVNTTPLTKTQMEKLGLSYILDIYPREGKTISIAVPDGQFRASDDVVLDKLNKIVHMMEAHQTLIDIHSGNEIPFRPVLDYLSGSLSRETQKG
jgi:anti-anti-sigma factor